MTSEELKKICQNMPNLKILRLNQNFKIDMISFAAALPKTTRDNIYELEFSVWNESRHLLCHLLDLFPNIRYGLFCSDHIDSEYTHEQVINTIMSIMNKLSVKNTVFILFMACELKTIQTVIKKLQTLIYDITIGGYHNRKPWYFVKYNNIIVKFLY